MTTPYTGPLEALADVIGGYARGREKKQERERQAKLDTEAKTEKDREFNLRRAGAAATRTKALSEAGFVPDDTPMQADELLPSDVTGAGSIFSGSGPFSSLLHAFNRTQEQPRVTVPDESGAPQRFRLTEPPAERRSRLLEAQKATDNRLLDTQKAGDKAATDDAANQREYGRFKIENKTHPSALAPYDPAIDYGKLATDMETEKNRKTQIDAAKLIADANRADRQAARSEKQGDKKQAASAILNRQKDYVSNIEQAMPSLENLYKKVRPSAITAALKYPDATTWVPEAIGGLTQDERKYLAAFRQALSGILHEESGARLSDTQVEFGAQRFAPAANDDPSTVEQKMQALRETLKARRTNAGFVPEGAPLSNEGRKTVDDTLDALKDAVSPVASVDAIKKKYGLP